MKRILVAGIGGASLGTEIAKCLARVPGRYTALGCDISPRAYGHYGDLFAESFLVDRAHYVESVLGVCRRAGVDCIIPGGEEPMVLLARASAELAQNGVALAANDSRLMARFSDKQQTFETLEALGFPIPRSVTLATPKEAPLLDGMTFPCVVKPATGSGGSSFVFLAEDRDEAMVYVSYVCRSGRKALIQEYLPETEGEFTIGVLSLPGGRTVGAIALRRLFDCKLSTLLKVPTGIISSGYSQGLIDEFPALCADAVRIATAIGSVGPINVQGRVVVGKLIPFEINPRFSASTYLRALAGFNEVDLYLRAVLDGEEVTRPEIRPGYYLRSLTETFVEPRALKQ